MKIKGQRVKAAKTEQGGDESLVKDESKVEIKEELVCPFA